MVALVVNAFAEQRVKISVIALKVDSERSSSLPFSIKCILHHKCTVPFVQHSYTLTIPLSLIPLTASEVQGHAAGDPSEGAA